MSGPHHLTITNPTGEGIFTKVELDGVQQQVVGFDVAVRPKTGSFGDWSVEASLHYGFVPLVLDWDHVAVKRTYHVQMHVPELPGLTADGYGDSIAAALMDLAERVR